MTEESKSLDGLEQQEIPSIVGSHPYEGISQPVIARIYDGIDLPLSLFHYTSGEGLMGILGTHTMRFADASYMNDGSETTYGFNVVASVIDRRTANLNSKEKAIGEELKDAISELLAVYQPIIFCFSQRNNLLNQWRDYGRDVVPYCIEFSTAEIEKWQQRNFPIIMSRVVYNQDFQFELTSELLDAIVKKSDEMALTRELQDDERIHLFWSAAVEIIQLITRFKNPAFEAEEEWRAICYRTELEGRCKAKYRNGSLGVVPYYEWFNTENPKQLPVKSVTVGPSPYATVSDLALKQFLTDNGYTEAQTYYSRIPIWR